MFPLAGGGKKSSSPSEEEMIRWIFKFSSKSCRLQCDNLRALAVLSHAKKSTQKRLDRMQHQERQQRWSPKRFLDSICECSSCALCLSHPRQGANKCFCMLIDRKKKKKRMDSEDPSCETASKMMDELFNDMDTKKRKKSDVHQPKNLDTLHRL